MCVAYGGQKDKSPRVIVRGSHESPDVGDESQTPASSATATGLVSFAF